MHMHLLSFNDHDVSTTSSAFCIHNLPSVQVTTAATQTLSLQLNHYVIYAAYHIGDKPPLDDATY